jgi:hypothetical protein
MHTALKVFGCIEGVCVIANSGLKAIPGKGEKSMKQQFYSGPGWGMRKTENVVRVKAQREMEGDGEIPVTSRSKAGGYLRPLSLPSSI